MATYVHYIPACHTNTLCQEHVTQGSAKSLMTSSTESEGFGRGMERCIFSLLSEDTSCGEKKTKKKNKKTNTLPSLSVFQNLIIPLINQSAG